MLKLIRTDSNNTDFINLVKQLDEYLKITDGDEHDFYNQFNNIDILKHIVVAYLDNIPVGCGAFKPFEEQSVEIKRMFTTEAIRGKGVAAQILKELEIWSASLNYKSCILETGIRQREAVSFYKKCKYQITDNYGQYKGATNSLCFKKELQ